MRLLFLATVINEHHEVTLGVDLAGQVRPAGILSHFVIHPYNEEQVRTAGHPYTLVTPGDGADLVEVVRMLARELRPDAVVLSDYLGHWLSLTYSYEVDPWFVLDLGIPVLPLDPYELRAESLELEIMGRSVAVGDQILRMPARLRPVPVARPVPATDDGSTFAYRRGGAAAPMPAERRAAVRRSLGLGDDDRLLVVPALEPQAAMADRGGGRTRELAIRLPALLVCYLRTLPESTHVLLPGPRFDAYDELPAERTHVRTGHTATEHDEWVRAADGIWASFFPTPALEVATLAGVPALLTCNSVATGAAGDLAAARARFGELGPHAQAWLSDFPFPIDPFTLWPWRWDRVMAPVLTDNPLLETLLTAEIFDEPAVTTSLRTLLYDPVTRSELNAARGSYVQSLGELPPAAEVVRAAVRRARAEHDLDRGWSQ